MDLDNTKRYHSPWIEEDKDCIKYLDEKFHRYIRRYGREEQLFGAGDCMESFYIVKEGRVRITISSEQGGEFHTIIGKPGCFFGELPFIDGFPSDTNAIAIVPSKIYVLPHDVAKKTLAEDAYFNRLMITSLARKIRTLNNTIDLLINKDASDRVVAHLINLCYAHGKSCSDGIRINIKFTQEELASISNLSRVSVSNAMSSLFKQGIIKKINGFTVITDIDALEELNYHFCNSYY